MKKIEIGKFELTAIFIIMFLEYVAVFSIFVFLFLMWMKAVNAG